MKEHTRIIARIVRAGVASWASVQIFISLIVNAQRRAYALVVENKN
jgi:hypothetical protein